MCGGGGGAKGGHSGKNARESMRARWISVSQMPKGSGFRVQDLRFSNWGFRVSGFGFRVSGFGFGIWGLGFVVWGLGLRLASHAVRRGQSSLPKRLHLHTACVFRGAGALGRWGGELSSLGFDGSLSMVWGSEAVLWHVWPGQFALCTAGASGGGVYAISLQRLVVSAGVEVSVWGSWWGWE
eukprot:3283648-Rhodomonas_salina.1